MHSDGDIRTLVDDLLDSGVDVINLQDLVNGVEWIAAYWTGKVCVDLDIDRQNVSVYFFPLLKRTTMHGAGGRYAILWSERWVL